MSVPKVRPLFSNRVGVVSKNTLELYRYYGTPGAKPVLQMHADRCSATASRERREIRIIHTVSSSSPKKNIPVIWIYFLQVFWFLLLKDTPAAYP